MRDWLKTVALLGGMAVATPSWAQSAEDLNRQELSRLQSQTVTAAVAPPQGFVADPVGLIAAESPARPAYRFPGLINLLGLGVLAGGAVVTTVLVGPPPP